MLILEFSDFALHGRTLIPCLLWDSKSGEIWAQTSESV